MVARLMAVLVGCGIAASSVAQIADFAATRKKCDDIRQEKGRDGLTCTVQGEGVNASLLVLMHTKATDPQPEKDRAMRALDVLSRDFYASGGRRVAVRLTNKEGKEMVRSCYPNGKCSQWAAVEATTK